MYADQLPGHIMVRLYQREDQPRHGTLRRAYWLVNSANTPLPDWKPWKINRVDIML